MNTETQEQTPAQDASTAEVGTVTDPGVAEAPAQNDAQAKAAEILAARTKGKKAAAPKAEGAEAAAPKAPKPEGLIKTGYKFLRDVDPQLDKPNRQQSIILEEALKLRGTEGELKDVVLREPLIEALKASKMETRQPHERVLGFYLNGWKKNFEGTDKKPAVPALFEVVKIQFKN